VLTRGFLDRVKIDAPDGLAGYDSGTVVPYSSLEKQYTPRKDARKAVPAEVTGQYLEKPVLHYTIGTRLTPRVVKDLQDAKVQEVIAFPEPPQFSPHVTRATDILSTDPDWQTQLGGFNIHRNFIRSATTGGDSDPEGTSYIPKLLKPSVL
jgi:hypothetical protein